MEEHVPSQASHSRGLLLVGVFKLSKAIFFTAVGAGVLHLVHKDLGTVLMEVVDALRLDPENRFVGMLFDKAYMVNVHQLRRAGTLSILYAGVCIVEGTGLVMEKRWAEFLTVILTAMGLPWESYELLERFSMYKVGLLAINLAVLLYLVWVLKKKKAIALAESD
jgi:uncharacterized membrane protein (DUF2068 family)